MTLHRALQRHEHDEKFLTLLGGLQSLVDRFDALLATHAPAGTEAEPSTAPLAPDITFLLGAIAIRDRLAASFATEPTATADTPSSSLPQESLLR